jgi:hypothetical protein
MVSVCLPKGMKKSMLLKSMQGVLVDEILQRSLCRQKMLQLP